MQMASKLTKQAAEDAQSSGVSGAVQEEHQVAPGAQVLLTEAKQLLHPPFGRCFIFFRSCILLGTFLLSISANKGTWRHQTGEKMEYYLGGSRCGVVHCVVLSKDKTAPKKKNHTALVSTTA